ncbi:hypothetical protein CASFOL_010201 [Castilleja foliolosa]|uniref:Uncharacterized protein n=1 Tax=Castilleja foliolosa TaxID=1961234 RepID=A0ABD3DRX2_9LAMI
MTGGGEIQLAQPIIQRIQSFLTGKEAAQTTIVSKSWHKAWLTLPNLEFDDTYFGASHYFGVNHSSAEDFENHAKKTIKRYGQSNLKIESFKLCMKIDHYDRAELANKLIVKALRFGATRLCLRLKISNSFVLPDEVFGADNLVELSLSGCRIKLDDRVVIKFRRLESLNLDYNVYITVDMVSKIVSSCPCIKKLSLLLDFYQQYEDGRNDVYIGGRRVDAAAVRKAVATAMPVGVVDNLIPRLRCLALGYVWFKILCVGDLLSRFPFLKDFTLYLNLSSVNIDTIFEEGIQISNCSLERIKLVLQGFQSSDKIRRPRVKFDVPSVREFTFEGTVIPFLSFMSVPLSREWESHVTIQCIDDGFCFSTIWFNELSELLTELSQSKTHLSLNARGNTDSFDYKVADKIIQGLRKHELENLTVDMRGLPSLSCYALFDGLFRLCRPKLITHYYKDDPDKRRYGDSDMEKTNIDILCKTLEEGINFKVLNPTQFMYGLNDLEEVNAQAFDMDCVPAVWKPIPFELLLDADTPDEHEHVLAHQRIRLLLKWKTS